VINNRSSTDGVDQPLGEDEATTTVPFPLGIVLLLERDVLCNGGEWGVLETDDWGIPMHECLSWIAPLQAFLDEDLHEHIERGQTDAVCFYPACQVNQA